MSSGTQFKIREQLSPCYLVLRRIPKIPRHIYQGTGQRKMSSWRQDRSERAVILDRFAGIHKAGLCVCVCGCVQRSQAERVFTAAMNKWTIYRLPEGRVETHGQFSLVGVGGSDVRLIWALCEITQIPPSEGMQPL